MRDWNTNPELSITLTNLRAQNEGAEMVLTLVLESGEHSETKKMLIATEQYIEIQPRKGKLTQERYDELEKASKLFAATRCGENILGYGQNTAKRLAGKIMRHGYTREEADSAAEYLQSCGLIDEEKQIQAEVEKCLRKLWGSRRIREYLFTRGFCAESLSKLDEVLEAVDFSENCRKLIAKHFGGVPKEPNEKQKMIASLMRYGYSLSEIKEGIKRGG